MLLLLSLVAVLSVAGCGSGGEDRKTGGGAALVLDVRFSPDPLRAGQPAIWRLVLSNQGPERAAATFTSGRDGDVVLEQGGRETYRWSSGRFFTQAVRPVSLGPGESQTFLLDEDRLGVERGRYQLVATLATDPAPAEARREVSVE